MIIETLRFLTFFMLNLYYTNAASDLLESKRTFKIMLIIIGVSSMVFYIAATFFFIYTNAANFLPCKDPFFIMTRVLPIVLCLIFFVILNLIRKKVEIQNRLSFVGEDAHTKHAKINY